MRRILDNLEGLEAALVLATALIVAVGWWHAWVAPNDAHMTAVMSCVENAGSHLGDQVAFERCHNKLLPEAGGLVAVFSPPTN